MYIFSCDFSVLNDTCLSHWHFDWNVNLTHSASVKLLYFTTLETQHNKSPRKSRGFETRTNDRTIAWTISKNSRLEERKNSTQLIIDNFTILCNLKWEFKYVRQMKKRFKRQQKKRHFSWSKSRNVMIRHSYCKEFPLSNSKQEKKSNRKM